MIHFIRTSRFSKIVASYLALQLIVMTVQPTNMFALTGGPAQPEFNSFTPIGTSDMVNLSSGDFNYNIPIMDVGGYPLNLAYDSGITMDQEASWVGLGWNLNVGQINRQVRGIPDDFKGDEITYENDMKDNITIGSNFGIQGSIIGFPNDTSPPDTSGDGSGGGGGLSGSVSLGVQYNNYEGITFHPSFGISFGLSGVGNVGVNLSGSTAGGAVVSPNVSFNTNKFTKDYTNYSVSNGLGLSISSRKGFEALTLSSSLNKATQEISVNSVGKWFTVDVNDLSSSAGTSGTISYNTNNIYTPYKRAGMVSGNFSFNAALGSEVFGIELQGHVQGYGSYQKIRSEEQLKSIPAFGYDQHEFADQGNSVLDFNREKDRTFSRNTTVLPIGNHTYDIYSLQGQGMFGQFRPHRGQVSYLSDNTVTDFGDGVSAGAEFGFGWNAHGGADIKISPSYSYTGGWTDGNLALNRFAESDDDDNTPLYEDVYYKMIGEANVDAEPELYEDKAHANAPMKFDIGGSKYGRTLQPTYEVKTYANNGTATYTPNPINSKLKRNTRDRRNTGVYKVRNDEAVLDPFIKARGSNIPDHHTAGMKSIKPDGSRYIYGETAYNWEKKEITVDVSGAGTADYVSGTVNNNGSVASTNSSDRYKNIITTPAYAHTYLLSSVLSSDYEDLTGDGPTVDDLGAYTVFNYGEAGDTNHYIADYNWRTPYQTGKANFNEGLKSLNNDQKGSIIEGRKELKYIRTIETKTHVAYFRLSPRQDAREAGGNDHMQQLDKIFLYTKPEYEMLVAAEGNLDLVNDIATLSKPAIKTAHFEYNYQLGPGVPNSDAGGRLTLAEVYFTYRGSHMGQYTPYLFNYEGFNPAYSLKGYDIWGCYKSNEGVSGSVQNSPLTTSEYPFVEQDKADADQNTSAWLLTSIDLPSGGRLEIQTEADDYQYVQDRKAMQMFEIKGFGGANPLSSSDDIYSGNTHTEYVHVKIKDENDAAYDETSFMSDYLSENLNKPIYFRALLNMVKNSSTKYDYVSGYFEIDRSKDFGIASDVDGTYVAIPLQMLNLEGGINGGQDVNPIAKAGWYFGRSNLNRTVYSIGGDNTNDDFISVVSDLISSIGSVFEIFSGPNGKLQEKQCAKTSIPHKSWVRLENPDGRKFGGGVRVTEIQLHDNWAAMDATTVNDDNPIYQQFYGQQYNYDLEDGTSSGVATYEPNGSKENPLVEPFYDTGEKLVAPKESNYTEKPFGESFFPAPTITYSRITVKNLERKDPVNNREVRRHATGSVVSEYYTSRDFPTITDYTDITPQFDPPGALSSILNLSVKNHLTFSQGFVVETNDMNGRMKSQEVFPEGQTTPISGVDYYYNVDGNGKLSSTVATVDKDGIVNDSEIGLTYDVFNDFRENYSESTTVGVDLNVAGFIIFIWPVIIPLPIPDYAYHETKLRTATNTKVIHRTAILKEKVARDLGSSVSTKNLAWDAHTGQILLTETINEYDDNYYSFTYPSHWYYEGMDMATTNIGASGILSKGEGEFDYGFSGSTSIFMPGDELQVVHIPIPGATQTGFEKLWVVDVENNGAIHLMNRDGEIVANACEPDHLFFKIVRSGYRNQQNAAMASVTSQTNPLDINGDGTLNSLGAATYAFLEENDEDPRIVNASGMAYHEAWPQQWESNLPGLPDVLYSALEGVNYEPSGSGGINTSFDPRGYGFNPYLYNVRGEWRAKRSYAYLSGRQSGDPEIQAAPRYEGYFSKFNPFYTRVNADGDVDGHWHQNTDNWTFASEVTQYSPYGAELENRDALGRHSAAQYGYIYTLPNAVASNSTYEQIGFDGFEDYTYQSDEANDDLHFGFHDATTGNTQLTESTAHTGRYSLRVTGETSLITNYGDTYSVGFLDPNCDDDPPPPDCIASFTDSGGDCNFGYTLNAGATVTGAVGNITSSCNSNVILDVTFSGSSVIIDTNQSLQDCGTSDLVVIISYTTTEGNCSFTITYDVTGNC